MPSWMGIFKMLECNTQNENDFTLSELLMVNSRLGSHFYPMNKNIILQCFHAFFNRIFKMFECNTQNKNNSTLSKFHFENSCLWPCIYQIYNKNIIL